MWGQTGIPRQPSPPGTPPGFSTIDHRHLRPGQCLLDFGCVRAIRLATGSIGFPITGVTTLIHGLRGSRISPDTRQEQPTPLIGAMRLADPCPAGRNWEEALPSRRNLNENLNETSRASLRAGAPSGYSSTGLILPQPELRLVPSDSVVSRQCSPESFTPAPRLAGAAPYHPQLN